VLYVNIYTYNMYQIRYICSFAEQNIFEYFKHRKHKVIKLIKTYKL